jgi:hypothetical protein
MIFPLLNLLQTPELFLEVKTLLEMRIYLEIEILLEVEVQIYEMKI